MVGGACPICQQTLCRLSLALGRGARRGGKIPCRGSVSLLSGPCGRQEFLLPGESAAYLVVEECPVGAALSIACRLFGLLGELLQLL